jgi:hypothetical protein
VIDVDPSRPPEEDVEPGGDVPEDDPEDVPSEPLSGLVACDPHMTRPSGEASESTRASERTGCRIVRSR